MLVIERNIGPFKIGETCVLWENEVDAVRDTKHAIVDRLVVDKDKSGAVYNTSLFKREVTAHTLRGMMVKNNLPIRVLRRHGGRLQTVETIR